MKNCLQWLIIGNGSEIEKCGKLFCKSIKQCIDGQWFSNVIMHLSPKGLVKTDARLPSRVSHSVRLGWGLRIFISKEFPGDVAAAGSEAFVWEPLTYTENWKLACLFFCILSRYVSHLFPKLCHSRSVNHSKDFLALFSSALSKIQGPSNAPLQGAPFPEAEG